MMRGHRGILILASMLMLWFAAAAREVAATPADYLFGIEYTNAPSANPYLYRMDLDGNVVWERALPFTQFGLYDLNADRNLTEDAFYLSPYGAATQIDGKSRLLKYDAAGNLKWDLLVTPAVGPEVAANPVDGGAYVGAYQDGVYRIDAEGNILWGPNAFGYPNDPSYCNWGVDVDPTTGDGYAIRTLLHSNGQVIHFDKEGAILWVKEIYEPWHPCSNPVDGGVYVSAGDNWSDTYRFDSQGEVKWSKTCFPSCYNYPHAVSPLDGSICISGGWPHDIARATMDGSVLWTVNHYGQAAPNAIAFDLREDALYIGGAGADVSPGFYKRNGSDYSQIWYSPPRHGGDSFLIYMGMPSWLEHSPEITGVVDVLDDQGGKVHVLWDHSDLDQAWSHGIASYTLWRRLMTTEALRAIAGGAEVVRSGAEVSAAPAKRTIRMSADGVQSLYWEYVASIPALGVDHYSYMAATTSDSMAASAAYNVFLVDAREATSGKYHMSLPDSGYSVDNLAPAPPAPFTGAYASGTTWLHWGPNAEADFKEYVIYRSASAGGPFSRIATRSDTGYADVGPAGNYYRLTAFDVHGNESGFVLLTPMATLGVEDGEARSFALGAMRPNPTRGDRLSVEFVLARAGAARLEVLDVAGRLVVGREVGSLGIGRHQVDLTAGERLTPGLYLVRLAQGAAVRVGRVVVVN